MILLRPETKSCLCLQIERETAVQTVYSPSPVLLKQGFIDETDAEDVSLVAAPSDCAAMVDKIESKLTNERSYRGHSECYRFKNYTALNHLFAAAYFSKIYSSSLVLSRLDPFGFPEEYDPFWFAVTMDSYLLTASLISVRDVFVFVDGLPDVASTAMVDR